MDIKAVPLPRRMRAMRLDHRGYPVPFIVINDSNGRPVFAANDLLRTRRCERERRCPICGNRLDRVAWFVAGPLSALLPEGAYNDGPMHYECMEYALKVCPYLAMRMTEYVDPHITAQRVGTIMLDTTMLPGTPPVFIAVQARTWEIRQRGYGLVLYKPVIEALEYWRAGLKLDPIAGKRLSDERLALWYAEGR